MKTSAPCRVEMRVPRRPEYVRFARCAAKTLALQLEFTYGDACDVELAVGEACTNAVEHVAATACDEMVVCFLVAEDHLTVEIRDDGPGFDPDSVEAPHPGPELDSGLGLTVIRAVMDAVDIESESGRGTAVRMSKRREGRTA